MAEHDSLRFRFGSSSAKTLRQRNDLRQLVAGCTRRQHRVKDQVVCALRKFRKAGVEPGLITAEHDTEVRTVDAIRQRGRDHAGLDMRSLAIRYARIPD